MTTGALRSTVRLTLKDLREQLDPRLEALHGRRSEIGDVRQDQITPLAESFISEVQPLLWPVEEFATAAAAADWTDGIEATMEIAGGLVSYGQGQSGLRFAAGLPAFLAWRLLLVTGAAAVEGGAFDALRALLREPVEVELLGGQLSFRPLPKHRELFFPETFLGYANFPMHYLSGVWDDGLQQAFPDQDAYREALIWFLVFIALVDAEDDDRPLYPGYRLIVGGRRAVNRLVQRLFANDRFATDVGSLFSEDAATFRAGWRDRAMKANQAELGGHYFNEVRLPLTPAEDADW